MTAPEPTAYPSGWRPIWAPEPEPEPEPEPIKPSLELELHLSGLDDDTFDALMKRVASHRGR
jgi:hypothetical protein